MPVMTGIEAVFKLKEAGSTSKVVFLMVHADADFVRACITAGALGYVIKRRMASDLSHAIRDTLADRIFISPPLGAH